MLVICTDNSNIYSRIQSAKNGISAFATKGDLLNILMQDLTQLRRGNLILKLVYDYLYGKLEQLRRVEPKPRLIVEGYASVALGRFTNILIENCISISKTSCESNGNFITTSTYAAILEDWFSYR